MRIKSTLAFTGLAIAITGAPATAATFSYHVTGPGGRDDAGETKEILTTFDDETNLFTWSSTFARNQLTNVLPDGGWLVVNNGPNPKAVVKEQAIFFLDGDAEKVSIYDYNGKKGPRSWKTSSFIDSTTLDVHDAPNGDRTFSFSFDATELNAMADTFGPDWKGVAFDEKIGVWFHGVDGLKTRYASDGSLRNFKYTDMSAFDVAMQPADMDNDAESVPEPGMALALGMTAATAAFTKLRKRSAA